MTIAFSPKNYYEIEALSERPQDYQISFGKAIEIPPPISEVYHCRCGKWWVIQEFLIASPLCPGCESVMSPYQDFSGLPPDYRYGNYGNAEKFTIVKKNV